VDVGEELEVRLPVDQRHLRTALKGARGADPREPAAHDHDPLRLRWPHAAMLAESGSSLSGSRRPTALPTPRARSLVPRAR
jgi:hypothetical protein